MKKSDIEYKYYVSGSKELWYLSDLDVSLFRKSNTLFFEFNSDQEQDSSRISLTLSDDQVLDLDIKNIVLNLKRILEVENLSLAFNMNKIIEDLQDIKDDIKKYYKYIDIEIDTLPFLVDHIHADEKEVRIRLKYDEKIELNYYANLGKFEFLNPIIKDLDVKFSNKELHIKDIFVKLNEILKLETVTNV